MNHRSILLILLFALFIGGRDASGASLAKNKEAVSGLTARLTKLLSTSDKQQNRYLLSQLTQVDAAFSMEEYATANLFARGLQLSLPESATDANKLAGQLKELLEVTARQSQQERDKAYAALSADFLAKYRRRAPVGEFDALIPRANHPPFKALSGKRSPQIELFQKTVALWQDYLISQAGRERQQAQQSVGELLTLSTQLPLIPRSELLQLQQQLKNQDATVDVNPELVAELQRELSGLIAGANSPGDFDGIVSKAGKLARGPHSSTLYGDLHFVATQWQDYCVFLSAGKTEQAENLLRNLSFSHRFAACFPRSKILPMIDRNREQPQLFRELLPPGELKMETLGLLKEQVSFRQSTGLPADTNLAALASTVGGVHSRWTLLREHRPEAVLSGSLYLGRAPEISDQDKETYAGALARIDDEIYARALRESFNPPEDFTLGENETIPRYCERLIADGLKKKDWPAVYRYLNTCKTLRIGTSHSNADLTAFGVFIDALQHERAELWPNAILTYYQTLSARSPLIPAEEIGLRLKRIREQHPEEFKNVTFKPSYHE